MTGANKDTDTKSLQPTRPTNIVDHGDGLLRRARMIEPCGKRTRRYFNNR
jgi:hypothetical protein